MGKLSAGIGVLGVALMLGMASTAHAQDLNAAREHYRKGTTLFDLQKYIEAAHEYELAYEAKDDPALLFNIAQSYRLGGDAVRALGAYKAFLRRVPRPANRDEVATRIQELQRIADQQKRTQEAPPMGTMSVETKGATEPGPPRPTTEPTPLTGATTTPPAATTTPATTPPTAAPVVVATAPSDARRGRTLQIAGIGVGAVGVVSLVVGIAMVVVAKNASDSITNAKQDTVFSPNAESAVKTDSAVGVAMLVVGGVAAATGATLFVLGRRESQRARQMAVVPVVGRDGGSVALVGRF